MRQPPRVLYSWLTRRYKGGPHHSLSRRSALPRSLPDSLRQHQQRRESVEEEQCGGDTEDSGTHARLQVLTERGEEELWDTNTNTHIPQDNIYHPKVQVNRHEVVCTEHTYVFTQYHTRHTHPPTYTHITLPHVHVSPPLTRDAHPCERQEPSSTEREHRSN
jgi:hypothetical protein